MNAAASRPRHGRLDVGISRLTAHDPGAGRWLVLQRADVLGDRVWTVESGHASRAAAERAAGYHDAPVQAWLLFDPALGWYRGSLTAWVTDPARAVRYTTEAEARSNYGGPNVVPMVIRTTGLITCPDLVPEAGA